MYKALYRKYRPATFDEVAGQDAVTAILKNQVASNRVAHAYLFTGTRGTGKTTCAKILAKAVNCLHPEDGNPCLQCESCLGIESGRIPDVVEIDAASNNGVDNIRGIRDETVYTPTEAARRVYIIDEVHMLSAGAFNALLKTLEEPPAHVLFILATTEAHKLPATILSRCQRFDFRRIPDGVISARLLEVAAREGIALSDGAAALVARLAEGGLRDALSLLEVCAGSEEVTEETVLAAAGAVSDDALHSLLEAVARRDTAAALGLLAGLFSGARDVPVLCRELIALLRDVMVAKAAGVAASSLVLSADLARVKKTAEGFTLAEVLYAIDVLGEALARMGRLPAGARVLLEAALIRLCDPRASSDAGALAARLSRLENDLAAGVVASPPPAGPAAGDSPPPSSGAASPAAPVSGPEKEAAPPAPIRPFAEIELPKPAPFWKELMRRVKEGGDMLLYSQLHGAAGYLDGDCLYVVAQKPFNRDMIARKDHAELIAGLARTLGGKVFRVCAAERPAPEKEDDMLEELVGHLEKYTQCVILD